MLTIIHGRGRNGISVLRTMVRHGLKINSHSVLAFCSAPQNTGESGATLVLIKKVGIAAKKLS
ncbi:Smr/MutS family protein [Candidatus Ichthyocystis sparus]|uniref:Smr/MutS family protein n=1 Tax=Candidatus Ichthyocystis sparus TaxID=1561004 RepID=UPI0034E0BA8C